MINKNLFFRYENALNSENVDNLNFNIYKKFLKTFDIFIKEILNENKELKKGFNLFDEKIKKYEIDHVEKIRKNEEIIEDLKKENTIFK